MATVPVISDQLTLSIHFRTYQHADQNQIKQPPFVNNVYTYMCKSRERLGQNLTRKQSKNNTTLLSQLVSTIQLLVVIYGQQRPEWDGGCTGHSVFGVKHTAAASDVIPDKLEEKQVMGCTSTSNCLNFCIRSGIGPGFASYLPVVNSWQ